MPAMTLFQARRFLRSYLSMLGLCTLLLLFPLYRVRSRFGGTAETVNRVALDLGRLRGLSTFPNTQNLRTKESQAMDYGIAVGKLKEEMKRHVLPASPLRPNEFQAQLRQAVTDVADRARANRLKLPDNFFLGFNEFTSALPSNSAAASRGQQLAQVKLLAGILVDARVDELIAFRLLQSREESTAAATLVPASSKKQPGRPVLPHGPKGVECSVVETTFVSTPAALRRFLNRVVSSSDQFYIVRSLHIVNEKGKGPPREQGMPTSSASEKTGSSEESAAAQPIPALNFIVGMERIQTSVVIELLRANF
jgi:hypothetical protein